MTSPPTALFSSTSACPSETKPSLDSYAVAVLLSTPMDGWPAKRTATAPAARDLQIFPGVARIEGHGILAIMAGQGFCYSMRSLIRDFEAKLHSNRSPRTAATYRRIAGRFLTYLGRRLPDRREVEGFLATVGPHGAPPAAGTRNQALAAVRSLGRHGVAVGIVPSDPTEGIPFLREPPRDPAVLSIPEVHRMFRALEAVSPPPLRVRDRAILALLFTLGLRVHELVGLDVNQVDAESATVISVRGKGGTVHDLPLEPGTLALVQTWLGQRGAFAKRREPALFVSRRGTRLSIRSVERLFQLLRVATGTKKRVTPHTARHSAATLALMRGADVSAVGELLRHADLNTTRRYLHLVDTRRRQVVGLLAATIPADLVPAPQVELRPEIRSVDRSERESQGRTGENSRILEPGEASKAWAGPDPAPTKEMTTLSPVSAPWAEGATPANDSLDDQDDLAAAG